MRLSSNLEEVIGDGVGVAVGHPLGLSDSPEDVDEAVF
jgi:hypothetical protein